jgi:dihydropteroate synthase
MPSANGETLTLILATRTIQTVLPAFVMGIINMTPDSFWSSSRFESRSDNRSGNGSGSNALDAALAMAEDGADIIDIGGESSRPGSAPVDAAQEIERIVPLIENIRKHSPVAISVDTRKKAVMQAAFEAGADILNDISALEDDAELGKYAAGVKIPVILMHKRGNPAIMQQNTAYADVFAEVDGYLQTRVRYARSCGIAGEKIIVDPGIGFGKDLEANRVLIKRCGELCGKKYPVLMALSRKTCVGEITQRDVDKRLSGTLAAHLLSVMFGARLVRVHDVPETVDCLKILRSLTQ